MNIEKSKLVIIGGIIVGVLLVAAIVIIAIFVPKDEPTKQDDRTLEEVQEDSLNDYYEGKNGDENSADIKNSKDNPGDKPPAGLYENDFSNDFGYTGVADHESAKENPANTVYDDVWASNKWSELNCDLNNKKTVSAEALKSLNLYRSDLKKVGTETSEQLIVNVDYLLSKVENSRGKRLPGEVLNLTGFNCRLITEEVGE